MADRFNIVKKGYDIAEVDSYIETLENVVKSYKEKDNAIKNAIISSQIAGDSIVSEAKEHANRIVEDTLGYLAEIRESIHEQKTLVQNLQDDYNALVTRYMHEVNSRDFETINNKILLLENYYIKLAKEKEGFPKEEEIN